MYAVSSLAITLDAFVVNGLRNDSVIRSRSPGWRHLEDLLFAESNEREICMDRRERLKNAWPAYRQASEFFCMMIERFHAECMQKN